MGDLHDDVMDAVLNTEFEIDCPTCGKEIAVSISKVGESIKCPHCGEIINFEPQ